MRRKHNAKRYLCHTLHGTTHSQNTFVHTRNHLADPSFHTSLVSEVSNVFAGFPDDNTSILGADECTKRQYVVP